MTRDAIVPTPTGNGVVKRRGVPNSQVDAIMRAAQGETIMEKQPNSRMCFVCGIDNPVGLHLAFYTDDQGRCVARFRPQPQHQGYPANCTGESYQPY